MSNGQVKAERHDGVAWVTIDNPPVNATSAPVRQGLMDAVAEVASWPVRVAILRCAGRTFVAGGDISEFDAPPVPPDLPDIVRRIEDCPVPWIAALQGSVFGGGLEIALGCAWRVALPTTRFALPEVNLGIVPGAGGTQRLPRLVGPELALEMATTGRPVSAKTFHAAGGLDAVLPDLDETTLAAFADGLGERPAPVRDRAVAMPRAAWWRREKDRVEGAAAGAVAPMENLGLIARAAEVPFDTGQSEERARHLALRTSEQSRALCHIFFAERRAARAPNGAGGKPPRLSNIFLPGTNPLAERLASDISAAGLQARRAPVSDVSPDLVLVSGPGDRRLSDRADIPVVKAQDIGPDTVPAGGEGDVVIGLAPSCAGSLAEIVAHPKAPAASVAAALQLAKRLDCVPAFTTPKRAYLSGRLLRAMERHAGNLVTGQDRLAAAWRAFGGASFALPQVAPAPSGTEPTANGSGTEDSAALNRLLAILINEGALALEEGCVADPASIDVVAVTACGFPRWRGGPMHYADTVGIGQVSEWMEDVMREWPGSWQPSELLRRNPT